MIVTDSEIVKALECCKKDDCDNCPNDFGNCYSNLAGYALDLINRQKAENQKIKGHLEQLKSRYDNSKAEVDRLENEAFIYKIRWAKAEVRETKAKAEAVKEFAERLKEEAYPDDSICTQMVVLVEDIDDLVKEMVGAE